jgi:hypothetical protein
MPARKQSKLGNWIHLHCQPSISVGTLSRAAFCSAFFVSGGLLEILRAARDISLRRKACAPLY